MTEIIEKNEIVVLDGNTETKVLRVHQLSNARVKLTNRDNPALSVTLCLRDAIVVSTGTWRKRMNAEADVTTLYTVTVRWDGDENMSWHCTSALYQLRLASALSSKMGS
jgi:sulfate adenylyltransferase subunit 1 (EFTu-like GTPase family)